MVQFPVPKQRNQGCTGFWHRALFIHSGIRLVLDSGTGCRFYTQSFVLAQSFAFAVFATLICQINSVFPCKDTKAAKSVAFCDSLPVFLWHRALFWHWNSRICNLDGTIPCAKTEESGVYRILGQAAVFIHRAFDCGTELASFVAQSFVLAAFATLVCQRNCVFLCKGTKQRNPACTGFRDRLPFLCTELCFGTVNLHNMPELYSWKINKRIKYWRKFFL